MSNRLDVRQVSIAGLTRDDESPARSRLCASLPPVVPWCAGRRVDKARGDAGSQALVERTDRPARPCRKPALKESPAPVVSTATTGGGGDEERMAVPPASCYRGGRAHDGAAVRAVASGLPAPWPDRAR